jgi:dTDP-4-amino-4,6-dideoxygalactose transaminase
MRVVLRSPPIVTALQNETIPVQRPQLPNVDRLLPYLRQIDTTRFYSNHGRLVQELERQLSEHLKLPVGCVVSAASGTAALIGAVLASAGRARPERPVAILPAFTFVATAVAAEQCGYQPYLADVDPESWMLDPQQLAEHSQLHRIGLVIPVAPFGRSVPQEPWNAFRQGTGIPVVIDGAASFEGIADHPDRCISSIPVTLSFHATKSFATAEGGAVISMNQELCERAAQALNFGFCGTRDSASASINGKMSEYHAAIGLAELDGWSKKRAALRAMSKIYEKLAAMAGLGGRLVLLPNVAGCYVLFRCLSVEEAQRVRAKLEHYGIEYRLWYGLGVHRQTYFAGVPRDNLATTDHIAPLVLGLPAAPDFTEVTVARVIAALADAVSARS